ncbi:MAG: phosphoribosylformylglycinamidine synthase [Patescibacteria group bacterium]
MERFYRRINGGFEHCFNIETSSPLTAEELAILKWLLAETFEPENFAPRPFLERAGLGGPIVEIGPRLNFETAFSSNAVSICHACGLKKVLRLERSRRLVLPPNLQETAEQFIAENHDRMTETVYPRPLENFETGLAPEQVYQVPLIERGISALQRINREMGLGMDEWDVNYYYNLFVKDLGRNPTNVECFQLGQANSEHCRHGYFRGQMVFDGQKMSETLFEIIMLTLKANPGNSVLAFCDNSSAISGCDVRTILPTLPGTCSKLGFRHCVYDIIFTAETHNFPSGVAPEPGAQTGTGGRIRDIQATGRGGLVIAGTAGYCVGNLNLADYPIPGEVAGWNYPYNLALPRKILIEESNGASRYGNEFGEPVIQGFTRTFGITLPNGERREWLKPIMFTGGVGQIDHRHLKKEEPAQGMVIVQIGGPAYRIGVGGGAASSMISGANEAALDFNAVQRGNAEMEQKMNRVIRACIEMGDRNPILSIHDQGAGGPCNVLTELVNPAGGRVDIRKIIIGDKTLSVLEIWSAEYQERNALLIYPIWLEQFQAICRRERVNCEVLGEITGDGKITVYDSQDDSTPVDLDLKKILDQMPKKTFTANRVKRVLKPLVIPESLTFGEALEKVFHLPSVGSKGFLVRKVDRSVTGLIAQQQCCGPLQLPVADVAVVAQSHFDKSGAAIAIGEQPIKMLVNPRAGARMAVAEMLTNMASALITSLSDIKCSVNWMWAAKQPGEGPEMYDAAVALRDLMIKLGIAADGGKDSLTMAAKVDDQIVKAPGQVVVSGYVTMPNITKKVTPDIKYPGKSKLMLIDLSGGHNCLGGSALAQALGQIGDDCPDVWDEQYLAEAFKAIQTLIEEDLILAQHDRSDGGLITTVVEMAMAGNCGVNLGLRSGINSFAKWFSEEVGWVIEYLPQNEKIIKQILAQKGLVFAILGKTTLLKKVVIRQNGNTLLARETSELLNWWEATSDQLEQEQMNPVVAKEQARCHGWDNSVYFLSFTPQPTNFAVFGGKKLKVAIVREEGSNGDREMTSAFFAAGFEPWDVTMTDLLAGVTTLDQFRGVVFVGGFSYADVLDSGKGWAGVVKFNSRLKEMFDGFYERPDIFSLGVCNGCQLMALLGWVPFKGLAEEDQPRFIRNLSQRFESRWSTVKILPSPAIMLKGLENSVLGIPVAHGEGRLFCPDAQLLDAIQSEYLTPLVYVDECGMATEKYPFNPNGSPDGITALCSRDGRHLAMMPHPERAFLKWQWHYMSENWKNDLKASPWLKMFQNAREWCG